jgi:hypothetical protein
MVAKETHSSQRVTPPPSLAEQACNGISLGGSHFANHLLDPSLEFINTVFIFLAHKIE